MKKALIPYEQTGYFSQAIIDYLQGAKELAPFYNFPPKISSFPQIIGQKRSENINREVLRNALLHQHSKFFTEKNSGIVHDNIESLKDASTFTVTTAHQPHLFLGPLYVIYKIISTILIAKKLNATFPKYRFVPVFWMGSEDHDKEELNQIHLFGKTLLWNTAQQGAFGRMTTSSLRPWVSEIKMMLGVYP